MRNLPSTNARYWATIVSACCIGETLGDFISRGLKLGYGIGSIGLFVLFALVLLVETKARVKNEARYWTAVVITSTTGTTMADFTSRTLKLGYAAASAVFIVVLAGLFYTAHRTAPPPSAKPSLLPEIDIDPPRDGAKDGVLPRVDIAAPPRSTLLADAVYWILILVVSTFGTTMGDFVSDGLGFGPGKGSLMLGGLLAVVLVIELLAKTPNQIRYWIAIVITSTVGATFGDFLTKEDGLELGYGVGTAVLFGAFFLVLIVGRLLDKRGAPAKAAQ
ncbi:MAG: hypothetical protein ABJE95_37475 [Byssovorax sp.]